MYAALFWVGLMLFFIIAETNTVALVSLWFALGALAATVAAALGAAWWLQILLFFGVAAVTLASLRPFLKKYIRPKIVPTNVDAVIGTTGYVTGEIDNLSARGQVKLGGMEWSARSSDGSTIATGTLVRVDRIEGVKVFVTQVQA